MVTGLDKAIVALVMAVVGITNVMGWTHFGLTQDQVTTVVALITPVLVWLAPNKDTKA